MDISQVPVADIILNPYTKSRYIVAELSDGLGNKKVVVWSDSEKHMGHTKARDRLEASTRLACKVLGGGLVKAGGLEGVEVGERLHWFVEGCGLRTIPTKDKKIYLYGGSNTLGDDPDPERSAMLIREVYPELDVILGPPPWSAAP